MAESGNPGRNEAFRYWLRLGFVNFGGPAGQIAIMHRDLVDDRKWISEERFLRALNFCMLLPGPEAQQLATYVGWRLHGLAGGLAAGGFFVLPSAVLLFGLSWSYAVWGTLPAAAGLLAGLKAAVVAVLIQALWRIGTRALRGPVEWVLAAGAALALALGGVPFPVVVAAALASGWLLNLAGWRAEGPASSAADAPAARPPDAAAARRGHPLAILATGLLLWFAPIAAAALVLGPDHVVTRAGLFFSGAAVVTFGGAYAVLGYVSQHAVNHLGWLTTAQMMDGLGLAETTPGPLIMVLQFVGFMAGWNAPGGLAPLAAAALAAAITTWVTFLPSFLFIFIGGPFIERMRPAGRAAAALAATTAAVVGVIAHLGGVFALHALLPGGAPHTGLILLSLISLALLVRTKVPMPAVILLAAAAGWLLFTPN